VLGSPVAGAWRRMGMTAVNVSYRELEAFVEIAAGKVANPLYRPNVYARGPAGDARRPLFDLRGSRTRALRIGPQGTRVTVRDRNALPWIDLHSEPGARFELALPEALDGGYADRRTAEGVTIASLALPAGGATLASLVSADRPGARGNPSGMLPSLFAEPFGPMRSPRSTPRPARHRCSASPPTTSSAWTCCCAISPRPGGASAGSRPPCRWGWR
jgi:hypothetical protein